MEPIPRYRFERLVAEALDDLPDELCPCSTTSSWWSRTATPTNPICWDCTTACRTPNGAAHESPTWSSIYRLALCDECDDEDDLAEEIYVTVIHELAHAAGIDDERLDELGWA